MTHYIKQPLVSFTAALMLLFAFSNCEKVVDLPVYEYQPSIVIFGVLEPDSVPKIFVTESEAYYTYTDIETEYTLIKDAIVEISDGNNTWELQPGSVQYLPPYRNFGANYSGEEINKKPFYANAFTTNNMSLQAGEKYTVNVRKNGVTATAEATVLAPLEVEFSQPALDNYGRNNEIHFDITNEPDGQYYKSLGAYHTKEYVCDYNEELYDYEVVDSFNVYRYEAGWNRQFGDDQMNYYYDDNYDRISIYNACGSNNFCARRNENFVMPDSVLVSVSIQLVDSNLMNYITQLNYQQDTEYYPFLEPAPVDHPVENGLGILTSVATSKWETFWVKCR